MELIDVHVHALPRGDMDSGRVDARLEAVLARLHKAGIRQALLVPLNDIAYQPVPAQNDYYEQAVSSHPNLAALVDIDLSQAHYYRGLTDLEDEISRRVANGLRGIKVHLQNLGMLADDWRLLPVYRLAGELGVPVMIHCHPGSCPGRVTDSHPAAIEKMVRAFHKTTFFIAHLGGILYLEYMPWLAHENVYFDTSGVMEPLLRYHGVDRVRMICEEIGYERILFGSDCPVCDPQVQLDAVRQVVPSEHQAAVLGGNALHLGNRFGWWTVAPAGQV